MCQLTKYMSKFQICTEILQGNLLFSGKNYTTGNNFTRPLVATVVTNFKSVNQQNFFLNWIIFWIESWVKQYWIEYWMNYFWRDLNIELNQISYWTPLFSSVLFYIYSLFYIHSLLIFILCFIFIHLRSVVVLWSERQPESASWSKRQRRDVEACPTWK